MIFQFLEGAYKPMKRLCRFLPLDGPMYESQDKIEEALRKLQHCLVEAGEVAKAAGSEAGLANGVEETKSERDAEQHASWFGFGLTDSLVDAASKVLFEEAHRHRRPPAAV